VFASGFRNPFRFSLRPGGGLAVGDVGWEHREEIDLIAAGGRSYGWPCFEGGIRTPGYQTEPECTTEYARPPGTHTSPTYDYPHAGSNAVVTGPTYAGARYPPQYRGSLFFGDFTGGFIRRLLPNGSGGLGVKPFAEGWRGVALESAPGGDLVTVSPGGFQAGEGRVSRIVYTPPPSVAPSPPAAPAPILPADTAGPRLRLTKIRLRRGRISGTVSDPSGVRSVKVAVRRRLPRGGCAWWLRPRRRLSHGRKSCDRPRWMRARLRRREGRVLWSVRLGGRLPAGVFRVLVRAVDNNGNASRLPRGAATVVRVKRRP
jgi:hypothetical protein